MNKLDIKAIEAGTHKGCPAFRIFDRIESLNPFSGGEAIVVRYRDYFVLPDGSEQEIQSCTYTDGIEHLEAWFNTTLDGKTSVGDAILSAINNKLNQIEKYSG